MNTKSDDIKKPPEKSKGLKIKVGAQKTRWRAGFVFGPEPIEIEVNEAQLAAIKADPLLTIMS